MVDSIFTYNWNYRHLKSLKVLVQFNADLTAEDDVSIHNIPIAQFGNYVVGRRESLLIGYEGAN